MPHDNVRQYKFYFTYEEIKDEVQVGFCDHIVNGTVKTATEPLDPVFLTTLRYTRNAINQQKIMCVCNTH